MAKDFSLLIKTRRSIKTFSRQEIDEKLIFRIFNVATWAPSAHNAQPWRFIGITDKDLKRKLAESMAEKWAKDLSADNVSADVIVRLVEGSIERFVQAPVIIVASITMEEMDKYPDQSRQLIEQLMATQSLAAAIQNLLLAAHAEGLGACWFCAPLFCQDVVKKVLGMPQTVEPQALITLGYPAENPSMPTRKSLDEVIFKNHWGEKF